MNGVILKRVEIKVIPNAHKDKVVTEESRLKVYVTAPAMDGKANKAAVEVLSEYFGLKKKDIHIVKGERNRQKIIEIKI